MEKVNQEPVAWMYDWHADGGIVRDWITQSHDVANNERVGCHNIRPLYTAPQVAQPLTDERAHELAARYDVPVSVIVGIYNSAHAIGQEGGAA